MMNTDLKILQNHKDLKLLATGFKAHGFDGFIKIKFINFNNYLE